MRRNVGVLIILVFVVIVIVIVIRCCWPPTVATPTAHLIIEHEDTADWITIDNSFSWGHLGGDSCLVSGAPDSIRYRPGVLVQLGRSRGTQYRFVGIAIYSGTDSTLYPAGKDSVWVDIVSDYPKRLDPPIPPDHAFYLYPNDGAFAPVACHPDSFPAVPVTCLRNRSIRSSLFRVSSLITCWPGDRGFSVAARQTEDDCTGNGFRFTFPDGFSVKVYRPDSWSAGSTMTLAKSFAAGQVDSIVVRMDTAGPTGGATVPLPWPIP